MNIVAILLSAILFAVSVLLIVFPYSRRETGLWRALKVRNLRKWAVKHGTENLTISGKKMSIIEKSNRNMKYHAILNFAFMSVVFQLSGSTYRLLAHLPIALIALALFYVMGSIVQRQKIAIYRARYKL